MPESGNIETNSRKQFAAHIQSDGDVVDDDAVIQFEFTINNRQYKVFILASHTYLHHFISLSSPCSSNENITMSLN